MTLGKMALDRATGEAAPFSVENGNIKVGRNLVLTWFNDATALIPMNARSFFTTAEHHAQFDAALIFIVSNGKSVMYPESIAAFMDPKRRFAEFLEGKLDPTNFGMDLNKAEQGLPAAYASARDKFKAMFTPPVPPRQWDTRELTERNKLTVTASTSSTRYVKNSSGHKMGLKTAQRLWTQLDPLWKDVPHDQTTDRRLTSGLGSISANGYTRYPEVYADRITIGCQTIQRNAIEALAKEQGWV